ncbi:MAG: isochorismate synthase [Actinomycetota bacterium]|nr:isochorismate synthase [Actinomycetota bacterium]MDH5223391.1 isochorismate synthase [Actinomycetota bacterium]
MTHALRASALGPAFDLLAAYAAPRGFFFEREGLGVAAPSLADGLQIGAASDLRSLARQSLRVLADIDSDSVAPMAVGALPYAAKDASLWVPRRMVGRSDDGETWLLELEGDPEGEPTAFLPERVFGDLPHEAFRAMQLSEKPAASVYAAAVASAVERIGSSDLEKVVLARTLQVGAGRDLDARRLAHRLRAVEPHCFTFAAPTGDGGRAVRTLVGASPELLVSLRGARVRSMPLAGTAPREGDADEDLASAESLAASSKNREEHAIVVAAVAEVLGGFCDDLSFDAEPVLEPTANVWHLATRFEGTLRDTSVSALDLVAELHPTPAVCGTPEIIARAMISELEGFDRRAYAGPVGWVDARGDGDWAISLRCAELEGDRATLYAGAGIVAASDPAGEVDETDRKFRAFLDSLRWS